MVVNPIVVYSIMIAPIIDLFNPPYIVTARSTHRTSPRTSTTSFSKVVLYSKNFGQSTLTMRVDCSTRLCGRYEIAVSLP